MLSIFKKNIGLYLFVPLAIFIVLNNIFNLEITSTLTLNPKQLLENNSLWTLFTFPLAENSILDFLFFSFIFILFYPLLQSIYRRWFFPVFFVLFTILQGALFTLIFWNEDLNFQGLSAISTFILVVVSLLYSKERFVFGRLPVVKVSHINLIVALAYLTFSIPLFIEGNHTEIVSFTAPIFFGISIAILFYLQIYFYNNYFLPKRRIRSINEIKQLLTKARESVETLESSLVPHTTEPEQPKIQPFGNKFEKLAKNKNLQVSDDPESNEDLLNTILDKISERGFESLTQNELDVLKQLSSKI